MRTYLICFQNGTTSASKELEEPEGNTIDIESSVWLFPLWFSRVIKGSFSVETSSPLRIVSMSGLSDRGE